MSDQQPPPQADQPQQPYGAGPASRQPCLGALNILLSLLSFAGGSSQDNPTIVDTAYTIVITSVVIFGVIGVSCGCGWRQEPEGPQLGPHHGDRPGSTLFTVANLVVAVGRRCSSCIARTRARTTPHVSSLTAVVARVGHESQPAPQWHP